MKVSINEYPLSNSIGFKEAMKYLHELGFDAIDYNFYARNEIYSADNYQEIAFEVKRICNEYQLTIAQMHANWFRNDDHDEDKDFFIKMNERAIEVCHILECPYLVMHAVKFTGYYSSDIIKKQANDCNLALFKRYKRVAEKYNIKIALENMFGYETNTVVPAETIFSTAKQMNEYLDLLGNQFVACLDSGHAFIGLQNLSDMIHELGSRLHVLHIHDAILSDDSHLVPYLGQINWDEYIRAIANCPNELVLSLELDIKTNVAILDYISFAKRVIDNIRDQITKLKMSNMT